MTTTVPVPVASDPTKRSEAGLFAADQAPRVIELIQEDLVAAGLKLDELVTGFEAAVTDKDRLQAMRDLVDRLNDGSAETDDDVRRLAELLYFSGLQRLLVKHHVLFPAYNILDEYFVNAVAPWGPVVLPRPDVPDRRWSLFGRDIGFPIGVPASVLTANSRWIQYFANNGFNVLTYKTVRSRAWGPNPAPNWAFVPQVVEPFTVSDEHYTVLADPSDWVDSGRRDVSTTNSFGVPSPPPAEWRADIKNALTCIDSARQLLIVSVMGDDYDNTGSLSVLARDFLSVARTAEDAGAEFIELNLSCPNSLDKTSRVRPPLCFDVDATATILEHVRSALNPSTKLVAKLSYLHDNDLATLIGRIGSVVDGVSCINTLQCTVLRADGEPTFPSRPLAGVSGIAIRAYALDFVRRLVRLRAENDDTFSILAMGGVTDPRSFADLYLLGADAIQAATGAFANPALAAECVVALGDTLPLTPSVSDPEVEQAIGQAIVSMTSDLGVDRYRLASIIPLKPSQTFSIIDSMVRAGTLAIDHTEEGDLYRSKSQ
jgi:dihydroorotate dehydrogenase